MFWKILRWGGTIAVILLVILAILRGQADPAPDANLQDTPAPSAKKFNF